MASNCEDVSAQMMELLYGELPADARASVDAHVAGCARCRAELDGLEKTRTVAPSSQVPLVTGKCSRCRSDS